MDNKSGQKKKIESLSDFLLWVNQNKTDTQYVETFFRGHADKSYKLQPSVYRTTKEGNSYRLHESSFYNSMLQSNPKAFANDNTTFDKLVRMQHHGLPTRLLDVTSNPLVALFFACNQSAKSDGKILLFSLKKNEILFPSEISRLALAGIESGLNVIELFYSIIDEIKKKTITSYRLSF